MMSQAAPNVGPLELGPVHLRVRWEHPAQVPHAPPPPVVLPGPEEVEPGLGDDLPHVDHPVPVRQFVCGILPTWSACCLEITIEIMINNYTLNVDGKVELSIYKSELYKKSGD